MTTASPAVQERRKFIRSEGALRLSINLLPPHRAVPAGSVNFSEGGLCLRVQETLEVRSLVRLQLTPRRQRPLQCTGRVTWVVQRLDLRDGPPFLFDVGIEFVDPPPVLRQFLARQGAQLAPPGTLPITKKWLTPAAVRGRDYVPRLERSVQPGRRWRLVVSVEGVPCFSDYYPSERAAAAGWERFKRLQAKR
ncbi:MAG: PilZ domain-containing protein [Candidatus Omnitrophica bacterium]|nr:PilZ domain-containing protein [Candidatus Omnitrophota bacterium]